MEKENQEGMYMEKPFEVALQKTCDYLKALVMEIDVPISDKGAIDELVHTIENTSKALLRSIRSADHPSIEKNFSIELLGIIHRLQKSPAFIQSLGGQQGNFLHILSQIENNIKDLPNKVEKIEPSQFTKR